jgi:hypothetical protein
MIDPKPTPTPTMNEETNTPEPLAAIIAEMRAAAKSTDLFDGEEVGEPLIRGTKVADYADRIEAAAEREYAEAKDYFAELHDGPSMICTATNCAVRNIGLSFAAPGNAAAMREALEWAAQFVELGVDDDLGADGQNLTTAAEMARAALASPARNCDRYADATEMARAFLKDPYSTLGRDSLVEVSHRFAEWAFAPAQGGGHA